MKIILALLLIYLSGQVYAQKIYPDKSAHIDKKMVKRYQQIVGSINLMPLRCDTVSIKPYDKDSVSYEFKGIYFDEKGRLRKYFRKEVTRDGSDARITMYAYYHEDGNLIYLQMDTDDHCNDGKEFYYIHKGHLIDFAANKNCGCCDEPMTRKEINRIRPVIGSPLNLSVNWELCLANFTRVDTLLKILKSKGYQGYEEFELIK